MEETTRVNLWVGEGSDLWWEPWGVGMRTAGWSTGPGAEWSRRPEKGKSVGRLSMVNLISHVVCVCVCVWVCVYMWGSYNSLAHQ